MRRALLAESLGTLGLVLFATGAAAVNEQTGALGLGGVAAVCGLTVFALIQAFGDVSGAHLNPAVTVGFWAAGRLPARAVLPYVSAQAVGGLAASGLVWLLNPASPTLGGTRPGFGVGVGLIAEIVLTFWLMLIVLRVAHGSRERGLLAGLTIGAVVTLEILVGGFVSGGSMNPIRSVAPAVVSGHLSGVWIYVVGPMLGALLAVGADRLLQSPASPVASSSVKKILFVCIENANRSQMAQAFAHLYGAGEVEAFSAGSRPSGVVNPKAVAAMAELGYDLTSHESKSLDEVRNVAFDYVVTMGCGDACPFIAARHRRDWQIPDPRAMEFAAFREVRDLIGRQVRELLAEARESPVIQAE